MVMRNNLRLFIDSECARNLADHKLYYCVVFLLINDDIQVKEKFTSIAGHTTDTEMKGTNSGTCVLLVLQCTFEYMGLPYHNPMSLYANNADV